MTDEPDVVAPLPPVRAMAREFVAEFEDDEPIDWKQLCEEAEARNVQLLRLVTDLMGDFRDAAKRYGELVQRTPERITDMADVLNAIAAKRAEDATSVAPSEASPE